MYRNVYFQLTKSFTGYFPKFNIEQDPDPVFPEVRSGCGIKIFWICGTLLYSVLNYIYIILVSNYQEAHRHIVQYT
jgi:hypothetical protein